MSSDSEPRHIVIIGGGIIGCTTAYYLATHPRFASSSTTITVLEASAHGVAQGASGKAGGLVAKWAYPKELVGLSFAEHVRLARAHDGAARWGWRFVGCGSWEGRGEPPSASATGTGVGAGGARKSLEKTDGLEEGGGPATARNGLPDDLTWVRAELTEAYAPMAPAGDTAQVHPYLFTKSMLALAQDRGAVLVAGRATAVETDGEGGRVRGVAYVPIGEGETKTLPATHVVLAAGVWSPRVVPGLALPVGGTRAHSITIRPKPGVAIAPYVLFTEIALPVPGDGPRHVSPEIYARPGDEVYCCGPGDDSAVPESVDEVVVDEAACESVRAHVASISRELSEGTVERRQACFLPVVSTGGGPIVGESDKMKGLFIATGHTCWGICNAPGTAKALAELIMDGTISCAKLSSLHPSKFS